MKISEMSEDEAKQYLYDAYNSAVEAHSRGELPGNRHPSRQIISWAKLGGSSAEDDIDPNATIEDEEIPGDPTSPVSPAAANRAHGHTAVDSASIALDELRIRQSGASDPEALIRLARLKREHNPAGVSRMEKVIPGYGRLK